SPGIEETIVEAVAVPLSAPSALRTAHEARGIFRGEPPADGAAGVQTRLWKLLRVPPPPEVVVAPVALGGRVVCLVLALPQPGAPLPESAAQDLGAIAGSAAAAF